MKLKYYLRGLGIGIIVTAVLMGSTGSRKPTELSDAQIIARAKELGMVDGVLSQFEASKQPEQAKEAEKEEAKAETEAAKKPGTKIETEAAKKEETKAETEAAKEPETRIETEAVKKEETKAETEAAKEPETKIETEAVKKEETKAETVKAETAKSENVKAETAKKPEKEEKKPEKEVVKKITVTVYPGEGSYTVSRKLAALGLVESADIYDKFLCQNGYDKKITTGNHEVEAGMTAEQIAKALTVR